jgi:hypothetical protein
MAGRLCGKRAVRVPDTTLTQFPDLGKFIISIIPPVLAANRPLRRSPKDVGKLKVKS